MNKEEIESFVCAVGKGDKEAVQEFLGTYGDDIVNIKDHVQRTPLMWAASWGKKEMVEFLIEKGARLEDQDKEDGRTALMWAVLNDRKEIVRILLEKGASPDKKGRGLRTALIYAELYGHPETAELLRRWPALEKQRRLKEAAEEKAKWLAETDCSKGIPDDLPVPSRLTIRRPRP